MKLQCATCGLIHTLKERVIGTLTIYSRCPRCGCEEFGKLKWWESLK